MLLSSLLLFVLHALRQSTAYRDALKGQVSVLQGILTIIALRTGPTITSSILYGTKPVVMLVPERFLIYIGMYLCTRMFPDIQRYVKGPLQDLVLFSIEGYMRTQAITDLGVHLAVKCPEYSSTVAIIATAGCVGATTGINVALFDLLSEEWNFSSKRLKMIGIEIWAPFVLSSLYVALTMEKANDFGILWTSSISPKLVIAGLYTTALLSRRRGIWTGNLDLDQFFEQQQSKVQEKIRGKKKQ